jgi:hypothetical protein
LWSWSWLWSWCYLERLPGNLASRAHFLPPRRRQLLAQFPSPPRSPRRSLEWTLEQHRHKQHQLEKPYILAKTETSPNLSLLQSLLQRSGSALSHCNSRAECSPDCYALSGLAPFATERSLGNDWHIHCTQSDTNIRRNGWKHVQTTAWCLHLTERNHPGSLAPRIHLAFPETIACLQTLPGCSPARNSLDFVAPGQ